jgi:hypothetical protein
MVYVIAYRLHTHLLHFRQVHLRQRTRGVSGLFTIQQMRIENINANAPAIGIISARNAGIDCVTCFEVIDCVYI